MNYSKDQAFSEPCWQDSWGQFSAPSSKASTVSLFWFQQMNIWILNKTQQHPWCYWQVLTSHKAVIMNQWEFCVVETTWNLNSSELSTVAPFTLTLTHLTSGAVLHAKRRDCSTTHKKNWKKNCYKTWHSHLFWKALWSYGVISCIHQINPDWTCAVESCKAFAEPSVKLSQNCMCSDVGVFFPVLLLAPLMCQIMCPWGSVHPILYDSRDKHNW